MIDINFIKQLVEIFDASSVNDLRIEQEGVSIKLSKIHRKDEANSSGNFPTYSFPQITMPAPMAAAGPEGTAAASAPAAAAPIEVDSKKYHEIRSPIVGTFYRAASPETPHYVEVGSDISPGSVLCIIEAMKLMNEIECDTYGKVAKILVENAQPVEYNQLLFLIDPA